LACLILHLSKSVGMKGNDSVQVIQDLDLSFPSQIRRGCNMTTVNTPDRILTITLAYLHLPSCL
jgi:hypothetical protein